MEKKSVKVNYIYNLIYNLLAMLLPLITTPYLSRILGAEEIGIYGYTLSIVTYFILFGSLGATLYGQREIAYCQDNIEKQSKKFFEIVIIKFFTFIISMIIFYIFFCINNIYSLYYKIFLLYMIANIFDISWFLQGIEAFDKTVIRNIIVKVLSLVLIFLLVRNKNDLWIYILIFCSAEMLGNITMWMYVPKYLKKVKFNKLEFKKHIIPMLALFIPQIAMQIYTVLDKTMVGVITNSMEQVGFYEQAQKIVRAALVIIAAYGTVVSSKIAFAHSNKDKTKVYNYVKAAINFVWFLGVPLCLGLIAIADKFVPIFYGIGYEPVSLILKVTSPILIVIGLNSIIGIQYLIQVGRQKDFSICVAIGAIVNIILNIIFILLFSAVGAALASVFSEIIILCCEMYLVRKEMKINILFTNSFNYFVSGIVMFIVVYVSETFFNVGLIYSCMAILIGMLTYFITLILLKDKYFVSIIKFILHYLKKIVRCGNK